MTNSGHPSEQPFLATTSYEVWFQMPGQDWRLWSSNYTEVVHAEAARKECGYPTRLARKTMTAVWVDDE